MDKDCGGGRIRKIPPPAHFQAWNTLKIPGSAQPPFLGKSFFDKGLQRRQIFYRSRIILISMFFNSMHAHGSRGFICRSHDRISTHDDPWRANPGADPRGLDSAAVRLHCRQGHRSGQCVDPGLPGRQVPGQPADRRQRQLDLWPGHAPGQPHHQGPLHRPGRERGAGAGGIAWHDRGHDGADIADPIAGGDGEGGRDGLLQFQ